MDFIVCELYLNILKILSQLSFVYRFKSKILVGPLDLLICLTLFLITSASSSIFSLKKAFPSLFFWKVILIRSYPAPGPISRCDYTNFCHTVYFIYFWALKFLLRTLENLPSMLTQKMELFKKFSLKSSFYKLWHVKI